MDLLLKIQHTVRGTFFAHLLVEIEKMREKHINNSDIIFIKH
jgi:hypothetical protein